MDNLLRGVAQQTEKPREVIIVFMNEAIPDDLPDPGCSLYSHTLYDDKDTLPLVAARNHAAAVAEGEILCFLDVDCIPHRTYLERMKHAVCLTKALVMGDVRYLPEGAVKEGWTDESLDRVAQLHPRRPELPTEQDLMVLPYHLFWSLSFALSATDFARLGGFDRRYRGYGGEDTDLAFMARKVRLPFYGCDARVYHQYHPSYSPPYNHIENLVHNANVFHQKWQIWPMTGWLTAFQREGYIEWNDEEVRILKLPDTAAIESAKSFAPYG